MSSLILNQMIDIGKMSYLELGVGKGANFSNIRACKKESVDINGKGTFTCTTDEFFKDTSVNQKWDIIFIDADHRFDSVMKDFNNSVKHCNKWVLIHDLFPPSEKYASERFCGDGYKLLHLLILTKHEICVMDENFGLTFVRMPAMELYVPKTRISYKDFVKFMEPIHLYSWNEMIEVLNEK